MPTERVEFTSEGVRIVGDLRIPADSSHEAPGGLPALVFTGPLSGVKDQVVGNYASRLADAGFVTLAFDHRNFGDSEGEPRQHEDAAGKLADLRDAVGYISSRDEVDPDRVAVVGVCLGGGYAVRAGAFDPRVRAIAGVGGAYNSPVRLRAALGAEALRERLSLMIGNAEKERAGAERAYLPAVSTEGLAIMPGQEPFDYYGTERSRSDVWENRMTMDSWWQLATLDALTPAELLDHTPFLVVHGKVDAFCTPEGAQAVFDRATGPKEIHWIESTNHIDIYDRPELVDPAVVRVAEFMARELSPRETVPERFRRALQLRGQPLLDESDVAFLDDVLGSVEGKAELIARWNARAAEGSSVQADDVVYADGIHVVGVVEITAPGGQRVRQANLFHLDERGKATAAWSLPSDEAIAAALESGGPVAEHPNVAVFRAAEEARARNTFEGDDLAAINAFLREDVHWISAWGGGPESRDEVMEQFRQFTELTDDTMRLDLNEVFADDAHAVSLVLLHMERPDKPGEALDAKEANVFHLDDGGKAIEFWGVAEDQASINEFWS